MVIFSLATSKSWSSDIQAPNDPCAGLTGQAAVTCSVMIGNIKTNGMSRCEVTMEPCPFSELTGCEYSEECMRDTDKVMKYQQFLTCQQVRQSLEGICAAIAY